MSIGRVCRFSLKIGVFLPLITAWAAWNVPNLQQSCHEERKNKRNNGNLSRDSANTGQFLYGTIVCVWQVTGHVSSTVQSNVAANLNHLTTLHRNRKHDHTCLSLDHAFAIDRSLRKDDQGVIGYDFRSFCSQLSQIISGSMIKWRIAPEACKLQLELREMLDRIRLSGDLSWHGPKWKSIKSSFKQQVRALIMLSFP